MSSVMITDYELVPSGIQNSGLTIPFLTFRPQEPGTLIGEAWIKPSDAEWTNIHEDWQEGYIWREGRIQVHFPRETRIFNVTAGVSKQDGVTKEHGYRMEIEHKYRRWYSFPAQVLLVGTIPIDAVIITGTLVVITFNKIFL